MNQTYPLPLIRRHLSTFYNEPTHWVCFSDVNWVYPGSDTSIQPEQSIGRRELTAFLRNTIAKPTTGRRCYWLFSGSTSKLKSTRNSIRSDVSHLGVEWAWRTSFARKFDEYYCYGYCCTPTIQGYFLCHCENTCLPQDVCCIRSIFSPYHPVHISIESYHQLILDAHRIMLRLF